MAWYVKSHIQVHLIYIISLENKSQTSEQKATDDTQKGWNSKIALVSHMVSVVPFKRRWSRERKKRTNGRLFGWECVEFINSFITCNQHSSRSSDNGRTSAELNILNQCPMPRQPSKLLIRWERERESVCALCSSTRTRVNHYVGNLLFLPLFHFGRRLPCSISFFSLFLSFSFSFTSRNLMWPAAA